MIKAATDAWEACDAVHAEIIATPATTVTGLAVKARTGRAGPHPALGQDVRSSLAAMISLHDRWGKPLEDLDWHTGRVVRQLIEDITAAAGLPLPAAFALSFVWFSRPVE